MPMPATSATASGCPSGQRDRRHRADGGEHLHAPRPKIERRSAHSALRVELQADEEEQQHHAELGEVQHRLRMARSGRRPQGPMTMPAAR